MNFDSQLRVSGRLLTAAIVIASMLMITTALSWFRSHMQVQENARRSVIQRDLQSRYREFYTDAQDTQSVVSTAAFSNASLTTQSDALTVESVSHLQAFESTDIPASSFVSVDRSTTPTAGGPSVTVPVTINVNNGELLSELLQVRQEVSNLQQMGQLISSSASAAENPERVFSYVVHDGKVGEKAVKPSSVSSVTSVTVLSKPATSEPASSHAQLSTPAPAFIPAPLKDVPEPSQTSEASESFEPVEQSPPNGTTTPHEAANPQRTHHTQTPVDNFATPDAKRVMPMSYQSVSAVVEPPDISIDDEQESLNDESTPFLEFVTETPQPLPVLVPSEETESAPLAFDPVIETDPPALLGIEALQPVEPVTPPSRISDRQARLSKAYEVVRGLPPESLFEAVFAEPAAVNPAFIRIPVADANAMADGLTEDAFKNISMPMAIDASISEADSLVQTGTAEKPQTSVPPIPDIAISEGQRALSAHELQIPSSLDPGNAAIQDATHAGAADSAHFNGPTDIFRLPDESEIAPDPARDRALRIAQSPASEEHFDTRSSDERVPLPSPHLTMPEMAQTPSQRTMPEFMPPSSVPRRPVYRTKDPNATNMSLAVRRFKKRMAQVTGTIGASMPEIDRPDFEIADIPLPGRFDSDAGQTRSAPQHRPSSRSFAKGYSPQQAAPPASRTTESWFAMPQFAMPQIAMPQIAMPQIAMPQLSMPGFMTAQQECEHCNGRDAAPGSIQRMTESPSVHRAMSTMRFVGRSKTVE